MTRVFILEDEIYKHPRNKILQVLDKPKVSLTVATNVELAKKIYVPGAYDLLLLDHDMHGFPDSSDVPNCGYQFILWMLNEEWRIGGGSFKKKPPAIIHSQNHTGAAKMVKELTAAGYTAEHKYFSDDYVNWLALNVRG